MREPSNVLLQVTDRTRSPCTSAATGRWFNRILNRPPLRWGANIWYNAAKATRYGVSEADAFKCITLNPAKQLGIAQRVGSITVGKDADLVVFDKHPFDMYTHVELTLIDGAVVYRRSK